MVAGPASSGAGRVLVEIDVSDPAVILRAALALSVHDVIRQPGNRRTGVQGYHWCRPCGVLDVAEVDTHTARQVLRAIANLDGH